MQIYDIPRSPTLKNPNNSVPIRTEDRVKMTQSFIDCDNIRTDIEQVYIAEKRFILL